MNTFTLTLTIIITHLLLFVPFKKIIIQDKINNDLLFIYLSNVILTISFIFFYILVPIIMFSFYISLFQMIFSYLLIFNIKNILGKYNLFSLPYFVFWVFIFSKVLIIYLF